MCNDAAPHVIIFKHDCSTRLLDLPAHAKSVQPFLQEFYTEAGSQGPSLCFYFCDFRKSEALVLHFQVASDARNVDPIAKVLQVRTG